MCYSTNRSIVMIVDDEPEDIAVLYELMKDFYEIRISLSGKKALEMLEEELPDIIILDIVMQDMDGYETCAKIKKNVRTKDIPVIFLTAKDNEEQEELGLNAGASDYIVKPILPQIFLSRLEAHLSVKRANDCLKDKNYYLEEEIIKRTREVTTLQELTIMAMSSLAEIRDNETGFHLQRTKLYARVICETLAQKKKYKDQLDQKKIEGIINAVPLHDIGKIGISDAILLKPGKLTSEEFEIMKTHTTIGKEAIEKAEKLIQCPNDFLKIPKEIVYCHHEKWDGSGYPRGLKGEEIPLSARIVAIADVYDALRNKRTYKPKYSHIEILDMINKEKGKHFSEDIVDAFFEAHMKFYEISVQYREREIEQ